MLASAASWRRRVFDTSLYVARYLHVDIIPRVCIGIEGKRALRALRELAAFDALLRCYLDVMIFNFHDRQNLNRKGEKMLLFHTFGGRAFFDVFVYWDGENDVIHFWKKNFFVE